MGVGGYKCKVIVKQLCKVIIKFADFLCFLCFKSLYYASLLIIHFNR